MAVVCGEQRLTYEELNRRANRLAHYLRGLGVVPEMKVGVYLERGLDWMTAVLGVWKAGGVYVPLDLAYPRERLAFTVEDAEIEILLTEESLVEEVPGGRARVICVDAEWEAIEQQDEEIGRAHV